MNHLSHLLLAMTGTAASMASLHAQSVTATNTTLGSGCGGAYASFYESFVTPGTFDLANASFTMIPSAGGYFVLSSTTAFLAPSAAATVLNLGDDSETTVALSAPMYYPGGSTTSLTVCANGFVSVAAGNGTSYAPVVANFLNGASTGWYNWHDYNPTLAAGGRVKFEQVGAIACVTWDGVWDFNGQSAANANTFQFQFDTATGNVHLVCLAMSGLGNERLVGYSPGGASLDPGSRDLSATLPMAFQTQAADVSPLTVTATTRPITGATWSIDVTGVPAGTTLGVDILGFSDPGFGDLTFLGLPGCGLRASLDLLSAWPPVGSAHAYALGIPPNPALVNFHLYTTAAVFVPGVNAFGALTANGLDGLVGDL